MAAQPADLYVNANAGYSASFTYCNPTSVPGVPGAPIDVSGWHARMTVRSSYGDGAAITIDDGTHGGILVDGIHGTFTVILTAEQTAILPSSGVYDLLVTAPASEPVRLVQGKVFTAPGVTR